MTGKSKSYALHLCLIALLAAAFFILPQYHVGVLSRVMVLAVYAMGYNMLFGYTGLLSLGHALFFAAGMYGFGLSVQQGGLPTGLALLIGLATAFTVSLVVGFLALRTKEVAFMIVTLMFAQAGYLTVLYFGSITRGDEGFVINTAKRALFGVDLSDETARFWAALLLFSVTLLAMAALVKSSFGRALIAVRENEERAMMLGYDTHRLKYVAVLLSGTLAGIGGMAYALLFGYVGATFASVQYSIFPLLWVLLGGAGTTIGPLLGVLFMYYLIDISSSFTDAYMLVAGVALLILCLFAPQGLAGELRKRVFPWLP
ncbi:branched-chain amino acid ABC transporter permease [Ruegeria sp.]|uniref:branched-chain amino acid ABC transporter permease n=1 Tax=Ruegeria sp. TaxID=1879320 RepID=UPI00231243A4|nr:branched-chain amino acid ABC transporter permease [Ruegeria sp.]MDA7966481.1 branched-chain amino acid ABC transporter permease [Ruegeria sp.]